MDKHPTRIVSYCLMPNHWHMVIWPREDGELTRFLRWLTLTHSMRWHAHHHTAGSGHIYQGRFKAFPIQVDEHLLAVLRYVERNALRANLVERAEDWRWSSLWRGRQEDAAARAILARWPIAEPANWLQCVNRAQSKRELEALRLSVLRGKPYGSEAWTKRTARRLELESTMRPRGRPRKQA